LRCVVSQKFTDVSEVHTASIIKEKSAARTYMGEKETNINEMAT
jgi:hypothetical protein